MILNQFEWRINFESDIEFETNHDTKNQNQIICDIPKDSQPLCRLAPLLIVAF